MAVGASRLPSRDGGTVRPAAARAILRPPSCLKLLTRAVVRWFEAAREVGNFRGARTEVELSKSGPGLHDDPHCIGSGNIHAQGFARARRSLQGRDSVSKANAPSARSGTHLAHAIGIITFELR